MDQQAGRDDGYDREKDPEVIARRTRLFMQYVQPYYNMIYKLCINYTSDFRDVEENYIEVLTNLFRGVETYDPSRPILTWLHICTKRCVFKLDKRRWQHENGIDYSVDAEAKADSEFAPESSSAIEATPDSWKGIYNDDIENALATLPKIYRDAFLLQEAGYSLKEIAEMEYANGTLPSRNTETIKRRAFNARKQLRAKLTRDGEKRPVDKEDGDGVCDADA